MENSIERLERQIDILLAEPEKRESAQPLTAEEAANVNAGHVSKLESWAQQWIDAGGLLLYYTAIDLNEIKPEAEGGWGALELNRKFVVAAKDVELSRHAFELSTHGKISEQTAFRISQQGAGVIPDDVDFDEEQKAIDLQGPSKTPMPEDDGDDLTKPEDDPNNPQPKSGEPKPEEKVA